MKISKQETKYLGQLILTWTLINLAFNVFGLFITKLLNELEFAHIENIANEFIRPLAIQSFLFSICLSGGYLVLKNKRIAFYTFGGFQFLIFHIIFVLNLKIHHGIHFESTFNNAGMVYLSYCGQYLVDILYIYFPVNGNFENGAFMPSNIGTFYIHWILLNIIYYFAITWISIKVTKFFFGSKTEIKTKSQIENPTDPKI
ncbi:MAG TPA: hypothetical protein VJ602_09280 [Paludibacter sp.]|nr:hypothetical protein [Paludibacter sp.]